MLLCVRLHFLDYIAQQAEEPNDRRAQLLVLRGSVRASVCVCGWVVQVPFGVLKIIAFGQGPLLFRFVQWQAGHRIGVQYLGGI